MERRTEYTNLERRNVASRRSCVLTADGGMRPTLRPEVNKRASGAGAKVAAAQIRSHHSYLTPSMALQTIRRSSVGSRNVVNLVPEVLEHLLGNVQQYYW